MKPYKELNKTEKTAIDITAEFWLEASKTGIGKKEWDRFSEIDDYSCDCGICEIKLKKKDGCKGCILEIPPFDIEDYEDFFEQCGYWYSFEYAKTIKIRKVYAKIISHLIQAYIKGRHEENTD